MDPALLKEREAFKQRAMQMPTVERKRPKLDGKKDSPRPAKKLKTSDRPKAVSAGFDYKSAAGTSQYKFGVLAKIVKFMKQRHQNGDNYPLTIDEILDETNMLDIGHRHKVWLTTEALANNPKIDVIDNDKYKFKPKYNIRDKKGLLRLLDKHDRVGLGGIFMEDIEESVPNVEKALKHLGDQVLYVTRPVDKRKVLFYNDKNYQLNIDEEFQKQWRSVAVEGMDETKIEEYLGKQGITSMQDAGIRKAPIQKRKKGNRKKGNRVFKTHNEHMGDILQDYSQDKK